MGRRERMTSVDTAWLRMDSQANLMQIIGVYEFEGRIDYERLRHLYEERFLPHERFRSRVVQDATGYYWELDDNFDLDLHVARTALPGRGTTQDLKRLVGRLASTALDPNKPLWQIHLVDNYDGGQALIVRIHHCIADGIALIGVLMAMTSDDPAIDVPEEVEEAAPSKSPAAAPSGEWDSFLRPLTRATVRAIDTTGDAAARALHASAAMLEHPDSVGVAAGDFARVAAQVTRDFAGIALMDNDTNTSLKGMPSGSKVVAWNEPLSLDDVKAVGKALGCSVNDVLLASVAGAIRSYLEQQGEEVDGIELRAMVPVNLRDPRKWKDLGNKFGLVPLLLPVGIANPISRVYEVRRRMDELKQGYTAILSMGILGVVGFAPRAVQKQALDFLAKKATAVMTNVPGPQQALYLAGAKVNRMMFWVPQSGNIGIGVSILSYAGGVQFGLITDKRLCEEPQRIIDRFEPEFEKLVLALCMLPWDSSVDGDEAENWIFPPIDRPASSKVRPSRGRPRQSAVTKAAAASSSLEAVAEAESATAPTTAPRPSAARRRRSAFASVRAAAAE
ncbi:MAG TPA: wax ester/triacylglycerol synthase family O-acyltransferase [Burkholderiaceae bacterium]|nr:wax ester/triacylglycerol synthase family O-acyltransferase [Burkholderiaceae bacterium]